MRISIRDLKHLIKEQIQESDDAGDFDAEGSKLVTTAVTALEEAQAALLKIAKHYDYKGPRFLLFSNRIDDMIEFIETK